MLPNNKFTIDKSSIEQNNQKLILLYYSIKKIMLVNKSFNLTKLKAS
jgi:hypothetical protein